jgi:starch synthase
MATAEIAPFAKVGGLGDVLGSLPPALKKLGLDVRLIMPFYGSIDRKKYKFKKIYSGLEVPSGRLLIKTDIYETLLPGSKVPVYLLDAPDYFKDGGVYAHGNNSERFLFFSYAALFCLPAIKFIPDILHCHDAHTALMPDILKAGNFEYWQNIKTLFTIHNFHYQNKTDPKLLSTGNLHENSLKTLSRDAADGDINFMVQGVLNADLINTVSPTYAEEITTSTYGARLEKIINRRKADLSGILNGIDVDLFDPSKDSLIKHKYSSASLDKKTKNKLALQKTLGLPVDEHKALVGFVSRLAWQKGIELIDEKFAGLNCQFVFLGSGDVKYEKQLSGLQKKYPKQFSAQIKFEIALAQNIYAASDIFIMPSRYEPCGLGQLIAMRYGTVPVVRKTGGLADTVNKTNGFVFNKVSSEEFRDALESALKVYYFDKPRWQQLQVAGMTADFSWNKSAREYKMLYKKLHLPTSTF